MIQRLINSPLRNSLCVDLSAFTVTEGCEADVRYSRKSWKGYVSMNGQVMVTGKLPQINLIRATSLNIILGLQFRSLVDFWWTMESGKLRIGEQRGRINGKLHK